MLFTWRNAKVTKLSNGVGDRVKIWTWLSSQMLQWNLYNVDTIGTKISVLISEVFLFQGCPLRGVPWYMNIYCLKHQHPAASMPELQRIWPASRRPSSDSVWFANFFVSCLQMPGTYQQCWHTPRVTSVQYWLAKSGRWLQKGWHYQLWLGRKATKPVKWETREVSRNVQTAATCVV